MSSEGWYDGDVSNALMPYLNANLVTLNGMLLAISSLLT